jgi:ribosomal protein L2
MQKLIRLILKSGFDDFIKGDRGSFARTSGSYAIIISHLDEENKTKLKLPSGAKKTVTSSARQC